MLVAVHLYGHEEPVETSWIEFESVARDRFYFEEDTLEELSTRSSGGRRESRTRSDEKLFLSHQAVPRAEASGKKGLAHSMVLQEEGSQASESAIRGATHRKLVGCELLRSHVTSVLPS